MAINLKQKESWELLDWVRTEEFKVQAVETRAQCKVRECEEEENEVVMLEENAGISALDLGEDDEIEDGSSEVAFTDVSLVGEQANGNTNSGADDGSAPLKVLKDLADKGKQGYFWDGGILMQRQSDLLNGDIVQNGFS